MSCLQTKLFDIDFLNNIGRKYDTPCYIYSQELIEAAINRYQLAFSKYLKTNDNNDKYKICYAVKANSNLSILSIIKNLNCSFDIVSIGELKRCLSIGINPSNIIFSGVGKTEKEIKYAISLNIGCFNCESIEEIFLLNKFAEKNINKNKIVNIGLRINPNINPETHPYISTGLLQNKFGITIKEIQEILIPNIQKNKLKNINIIGIGFHIGSQIMKVSPILQSIKSILPLIDQFNNIQNTKIHHIDIGGGLGINYDMIPFKMNENKPNVLNCNIDGNLNGYQLYDIFEKNIFNRIDIFIDGVMNTLYDDKYNGKYKDLSILCEPGRSIVGYCSILLCKVLFVKKRIGLNKDFVVIDGSMSEFIRPSLYQGIHPIILLKKVDKDKETRNVDIVGPVCESGDFLGKGRKIKGVERNDLLAVCHVGAYGYVMSSNYNSRPSVMELLIDNHNKLRVIKPRQTIENLYNDELTLLNSKL